MAILLLTILDFGLESNHGIECLLSVSDGEIRSEM